MAYVDRVVTVREKEYRVRLILPATVGDKYTATSLDFAGTVSFGDTEAEALEAVAILIENRFRDIPEA